MKRFVIGVTGASGIPYTRRVLKTLAEGGHETHVVFSDPALQVWRIETEVPLKGDSPTMDELAAFIDNDPSNFVLHRNDNFAASISSGSFQHDGMAVVPCTVATLGRIANGTGEGLIGRAAEVTLKEGRKLLLVTRETPYSLIALRNMVTVTEAGARIVDANPAFYHRPESVQDMVDFVALRVLDQLGVTHSVGRRWGE